MGTTLIGMLHQGQVSIYKMDQSAEAIWWHRMHREIREKNENCPSCTVAGKNLKTQVPHTEIDSKFLTNRTKKSNWTSLVQSNPEHVGTFIF